MIRIFFRHVWDSLKNLKRNGWMTVAAVSSVMITLTLVGVFLSVIVNTTKLAGNLENNVRIVAYMKLDTHDQSKTITDPNDSTKTIDNPNYQKVYKEIKAIPNVVGLKFSSKEDQLANLTKSLGQVWNLYKGDANPLYDAYIVRANDAKNVEQVTTDIKKLTDISDANNGGVNTKQIFALSNAVQTYGLIFAALLIFVAMFLISNTIRITIISRSREIQIMRLVGAKNSYIRWPFFLEGAWVGLIGSIIPVVLMFVLYRVVYAGIQPSLSAQELYMYGPDVFLTWMSVGLAALGVVIGSLGATISMGRYLKA
ncbi:MAG: permease-like cell division protein FtsX [Streptococcaceae bacterium]|jgi:cell division transport system permease protein|nr:permease-like cell division protein FtsX [Streptococcaceae bacterium]